VSSARLAATATFVVTANTGYSCTATTALPLPSFLLTSLFFGVVPGQVSDSGPTKGILCCYVLEYLYTSNHGTKY